MKGRLEILDKTKGTVVPSNGGIRIDNPGKFTSTYLDGLVFDSVFHSDPTTREAARSLIHEAALELGAISYSIQDLYAARGRGEVAGFTVPAINIRALSYEFARAIFRAAKKNQCGAMIFELARSEMGYTDQRPAEYSTCVLAAAMREGYRGPVFIQGDHFQVNAKKYAQDPQKEVNAVKELCREAIAARYFNIDIDTSTLVDLSQKTIREQQRVNFELGADITALIRQLEPKGITVSVGGEIGEVGGKNSTVEELQEYMDGYLEVLKTRAKNAPGISKVSIQTGTSHGGVVLPDGTVARVKLDFDCLQTLSRVAREKYRISGAVQHGASTLPPEAFDHFPRAEAAEVHLATEFQNMMFDVFSEEFRKELYAYCDKECADERKSGETDEQFYYKTRKKAVGPYKRQTWTLPAPVLTRIGESWEAKVEFLMKKLNVVNSAEMVNQKVRVNREAVAKSELDVSGKTVVAKISAKDESIHAD